MAKLEDYCLNITDGEHGSVVDDNNGEYYLLSNKNMIDGEIVITSNDRKISEENFRKINKRTKLSVSDVLISTVGTIGKIAMVDGNVNYDFQRSVGILKCNTHTLLPKFLYYYLNSPYIQNKLIKTSKGAIQKCLFINDLKNLEVSIPPIPLQKKISNTLALIDNKIKLNNKINAELENMAKTLYDYWFVQFDFPDENKRPYKSANGKMVYNEVLKREIPDGWEVKNIFDVLDIQYGYPFNTELFTGNKGYSVVRIRDILTNSISAHTVEKADGKYKLHEGDLLIGMDGNFHMNYWNETGAYLNQRCVRIRCKKGTPLSVIQAKYSLEPFIKKREQNISRTTVGHLSDKDFKSQYILVPKINPYFNPKKAFECILYKITNNNNEIKKLVSLRDFLLPLLMNGQVSVQC